MAKAAGLDPRVFVSRLRALGLAAALTSELMAGPAHLHLPFTAAKGPRQDEFGFHLVPFIADFAGRAGGGALEEARGWLEEQRSLGAEGRFFFSMNRYLVLADKPRAG